MDRLTPERRSENMRRIKSRDMKPELTVRSLIHRMGYRFRLHAKDLPGKPDLVFRARRKVIFVHGCFWHGHDDPRCLDGRRPKSNGNYWGSKLDRNRERDADHLAALAGLGWQALVIWECQLRNEALIKSAVQAFLASDTRTQN